jgi:hypothetical protein
VLSVSVQRECRAVGNPCGRRKGCRVKLFSSRSCRDASVSCCHSCPTGETHFVGQLVGHAGIYAPAERLVVLGLFEQSGKIDGSFSLKGTSSPLSSLRPLKPPACSFEVGAVAVEPARHADAAVHGEVAAAALFPLGKMQDGIAADHHGPPQAYQWYLIIERG